jgi:hypothetical protein
MQYKLIAVALLSTLCAGLTVANTKEIGRPEMNMFTMGYIITVSQDFQRAVTTLLLLQGI